jgi:hypothetical protein
MQGSLLTAKGTRKAAKIAKTASGEHFLGDTQALA